MPLPAELDKSVRKSFADLIDHGHEMLHGLSEETEFMLSHVILGEVTAMRMKTQTLARLVLGTTSQRGMQLQEHIAAIGTGFNGIRELVGILEALQHDYVNGFNLDIEEAILSNVSRDYMSQAETLLGEGIPGRYDYVPAAVLCGAVLEDRLRRFCEQQHPPITVTKQDGSFKTLGPLIGELERQRAFDTTTFKNLKLWAGIRNSAAHGRFEEFNRRDVEKMLADVKHFLEFHI